jgi:hypothetical protein
MDTLEMSNIGRQIGSCEVIHAFIEARMEGDFDTLGVKIIPEDVLGGIAKETKEDSFTGVVLEFARASAGWSNPNATTKRTHVTKVGFVAKAKKVRRVGLIFEGEGIFNAEIAVEGVGPEVSIEIGASEHRAQSIADGLVGTSNGTVLVGTVSAGRQDIVSVTLKKSANFVVIVKFASLVQVDILTRDFGSVLLQPVIKPVEGSAFGDTRGAVKSTGGMVSNQNVAHLAIEAAIGGAMSLVFGALASEGKICG